MRGTRAGDRSAPSLQRVRAQFARRPGCPPHTHLPIVAARTISLLADARHYKGKLLVRFDDTNPSKEKEEFEQNILHDLASLGAKPDAISHSSDHFDRCQEIAKTLLREGKAFMDDTDQETMQAERKELLINLMFEQLLHFEALSITK